MSKGATTVEPSKLLEGRSRRVRGIGGHIDDVILKGDVWRANVSDAVLSATLTRTITGASSIPITVADPNGKILRSQLLTQRYDIELDGLHFRFVSINKQDGQTLVLNHEDREVSRLRVKSGPKKAFRDRLTRAEFVLELVRSVPGAPIPFFSPHLHQKQPIANDTQARSQDAGEPQPTAKGIGKDAQPGLDSAGLTVKGVRATSAQVSIGDTILRVGDSLGANDIALTAGITTAITESGMGSASSNVFQLTGPKSGSSPDAGVASQAHAFFAVGFTGRGGAIALSKSMTDVAAICQAVQGSGAGASSNGHANYGPWVGEAQKWVQAFGGGGGATALAAGGTATETITKRYAFERRPSETDWAAIVRLAQEVKWDAFCSNGIVYFVAEPDLLAARVEMVAGPDEPGIDLITFDYNLGKPVNEVQVTAHTKAWAAPPGCVAKVIDQGPADGRYIVSDITSDLLNPDQPATITLKRPTKPLPEPAPETTTKTFSVVGGSSATGVGSVGALAGVSISSTSPGPPDWGGTFPIFEQFVTPFMRKQGLSPGSAKRTPAENSAVGGSPVSDHLTTETTSYAIDYPTSNGTGPARALAHAMGDDNWQPNSYATFNINVDGHSFRCQILNGAAIEHGDHVHVGLRLL